MRSSPHWALLHAALGSGAAVCPGRARALWRGLRVDDVEPGEVPLDRGSRLSTANSPASTHLLLGAFAPRTPTITPWDPVVSCAFACTICAPGWYFSMRLMPR